MMRRFMKSKGRWSLLVALVALALASLACGIGGLSDPEPTAEPTPEPTVEPTDEPTDEPTAEPTEAPTDEPTPEPTEAPTDEPTEEAAASGGGKDDDTASGSGDGFASLDIVNDSSDTVCYVYVSPSDATEWGDDQLGSENIIASGETFTLNDIPAGNYDLRADDCDGNSLIQEFGILMEAGPYTWTLSDIGVTFTIVNNSSADICWIYLSPSEDDEWGPDQLGDTNILAAGSSWDITGIEPGTYDLRVEACDDGELEDYGLDVSGDFEYTVTD